MEDSNSINILKSALDSYPEREVSDLLELVFLQKVWIWKTLLLIIKEMYQWLKNKHLFDIKNKGKMPKTFIFTGRVIFISNLKNT